MRKGRFGSGSSDSAYLYIAWASAADGTGFTMVFNPALKYIAVKTTTAPIAVPVVGDFAGLWTKYIGENGEPGASGNDGAPGSDGDDGASAFVYVAYASAADGTGFTLTFNAALDYIAIKATTVAIPAPVVGDFAGLWKNYKGAAGAAGAVPLQITGLTLLSASWSLVSGLYEYNLSNANITAAMVADVIPENADIATVKAADIYPKTVSSAGSVKLYAKNAPTANIGVTIILTIATT